MSFAHIIITYQHGAGLFGPISSVISRFDVYRLDISNIL